MEKDTKIRNREKKSHTLITKGEETSKRTKFSLMDLIIGRQKAMCGTVSEWCSFESLLAICNNS